MVRWLLTGLCGFWLVIGQVQAQGFSATVARVKPSIVGIATVDKLRRPPINVRGTGFIVADGNHVLTNYHVLPESMDANHREFLAVLVGTGSRPDVRQARVIAEDQDHDIALLAFGGKAEPTMALGDSEHVREGEEYLFTGFPIGSVLGLYPVTHHAFLSSITPVVTPAHSSGQLDAKQIKRLRQPFFVFQLDATAYPGNSGSPLYDPETRRVVGILNKVFVQDSKENVLERPSGISYAIPIRYAKELLRRQGLAE